MSDGTDAASASASQHPLTTWQYAVDQDEVRAEITEFGRTMFIRYGTFIAVVWESADGHDCVVELQEKDSPREADDWIRSQADLGYWPSMATRRPLIYDTTNDQGQSTDHARTLTPGERGEVITEVLAADYERAVQHANGTGARGIRAVGAAAMAAIGFAAAAVGLAFFTLGIVSLRDVLLPVAAALALHVVGAAMVLGGLLLLWVPVGSRSVLRAWRDSLVRTGVWTTDQPTDSPAAGTTHS